MEFSITLSGIAIDAVVVQVDAFPSRVVVDVLGLAFLGGTPRQPPAGLFFDFEPNIHILGEEALAALGEMPHFVHFLHHVPLLHRLLQFGCAPGAGQGPMLGRVGTTPGLGVEREVQLVFHAGSTQGKREFIPRAIGQDGMVQAWGRQHHTFGQPKVWVEVHGVGGIDELWVPHGVAGVLVDPRVETRVIVVTDLFPLVGGAMQLHHIGASERLARLQRGLEVQGSHVVDPFGLVLESLVPVAFPHLHHRVPAVSQTLDFSLGGAKGILHGPVQ